MLHRLCYFNGSAAVGGCLHHAHQLGGWLQLHAEVVDVVEHRVEVDLHHRVVCQELEASHDLPWLKWWGNLQQDSLILEIVDEVGVEKLKGGAEEMGVRVLKEVGVCHEVGAQEDDPLHTVGLDDLADVVVEHLADHLVGIDVGYDQRAGTLSSGLLLQETQRMFRE